MPDPAAPSNGLMLVSPSCESLAISCARFTDAGMNDSRESSFDTAVGIAAGDDGTAYDQVSIWLHWATALLVIIQFALAQTWDWFAKPTRNFMEDTHMSLGVM